MTPVNTIVISGRLTNDPNTYIVNKETGAEICRFGIAHNLVMFSKSGKRQEVFFIEVSCTGVGATFAKKHLRKGEEVVVTGTLTVSSYVAKTGEARTKTLIYAIKVDKVWGVNSNENHIENDDVGVGRLDTNGQEYKSQVQSSTRYQAQYYKEDDNIAERYSRNDLGKYAPPPQGCPTNNNNGGEEEPPF